MAFAEGEVSLPLPWCVCLSVPISLSTEGTPKTWILSQSQQQHPTISNYFLPDIKLHPIKSIKLRATLGLLPAFDRVPPLPASCLNKN